MQLLIQPRYNQPKFPCRRSAVRGTPMNGYSIRILNATVLLWLWLLASTAPAQMIDQNHNGISDVWEWVYGAINVNPNADPDGDGFSNLQEAIAGTNPYDSHSFPRIPITFSTATNFSVTLPAALGKMYQLQSLTALGSTNWLVETNLEALSGTNLTLSAPTANTLKFYRVAISDVNSDGTGLMNDWEKSSLASARPTPGATASRTSTAMP